MNICSGCNKQESVCMCRSLSASINPDGTIKPEFLRSIKIVNKTQAERLKEIAEQSQEAKLAIAAKNFIEHARSKANQAAIEGRMETKIWLKETPWTKKEAERAALELEKDGFKCTVKDEVTAHYSNVDWASEDVLILNWE